MPPAPLRIVFLDAMTFGDVSLDAFRKTWDCTVHSVTAPEELLRRIDGFPIVVTNKVALDRSIMNATEARSLRFIAEAATGTDNIDLAAARERGIAVANVPGYAAQSVAQFTIALILELATRAGAYIDMVHGGGWEKSPIYTRLDFPVTELAGKKLGIIGYGNIGRRVAEIARGLGMEVLIALRPGTKEASAGRLRLDELLAKADFISLHCPLTPATKGVIDARALGLMKRSAFLINTARGALVDEAALIAALGEKKIAGAALDVLSREPPPADHPIIRAAKEMDNLLVTPHCAWSAREARERLLAEVKENILAFTRGQERNRVA
ncbi:MAG TPA: D-2-hydroxyacid dehydrogenase [Verrucomicrobiae bacterium]|jgi:glycerate dehydrogenase|nr:D-2-hydroxyacid dehydrogenase [Verrucomicrobiae bacterium]